MVFGSFLSKAGKVNLTSADNKEITINKSIFEKTGIRLMGIPHLGLRGRARIILNNSKLRKDCKILDAGCGPGLYTSYFASKGYDITGIDIDQKKIDVAKKINKRIGCNSKFIKCDLRKLPFETNSFDLVICSDVIEHIDKDYKAIEELSRVLKGRGKLILTTTGNNNFTKKFKKIFMHKRDGYSKDDFLKLINNTELRLVKNIPYFSFFGKAAWLINRRFSKSNILSAALFYPLFWISFLDLYLKIDFNPFNRIFIVVKKRLNN